MANFTDKTGVAVSFGKQVGAPAVNFDSQVGNSVSFTDFENFGAGVWCDPSYWCNSAFWCRNAASRFTKYTGVLTNFVDKTA